MGQPASAFVSIVVNGEERPVPAECTIATLLESLELGTRRVAVALNRDVIPRSNSTDHTISPGDRIEILEAVGGG